jgi:hypothetical protein
MKVLKHLIICITSASIYLLQLSMDFILSKEQDMQCTYNVVQLLLQ